MPKETIISLKEKDYKLFYLTIILILIYFIGRIFSIFTYNGIYTFIENTISSSGYIFVNTNLNFPSVTWFGISLFSLSLVGFIFLYLLIIKTKDIEKKSYILVLKILTFIQISCLILLPVFPADILLEGHMILTIVLFTSIVITSFIFMLSFKRKLTIFIFALAIISFILLGIIYLINYISVLGLFEKIFSFICIFSFLNSIYILCSN